MGFADGGGMQGEARHLGQQGNPGRLFQRRHAVQGEGLSPGMRADLDAVGNRGRPQVVEAGTGHQVQIGVIRIGDQQATPLKQPHDAPAVCIQYWSNQGRYLRDILTRREAKYPLIEQLDYHLFGGTFFNPNCGSNFGANQQQHFYSEDMGNTFGGSANHS